jgi:hypothetical protein
MDPLLTPSGPPLDPLLTPSGPPADQMLIDGVFNADPHPGNVLFMPDGRLGPLLTPS